MHDALLLEIHKFMEENPSILLLLNRKIGDMEMKYIQTHINIYILCKDTCTPYVYMHANICVHIYMYANIYAILCECEYAFTVL